MLIHDSFQKTLSALSAESYADVGESATSACSCTRRAGQCYAMLCSAVQCSAALSAQRSTAQCLANIRVPLSPVPLHRARPCEMHPRLPFQLALLDALAGLGAIARETGGLSVGQRRGLALIYNGYIHIGVASSPDTNTKSPSAGQGR